MISCLAKLDSWGQLLSLERRFGARLRHQLRFRFNSAIDFDLLSFISTLIRCRCNHYPYLRASLAPPYAQGSGPLPLGRSCPNLCEPFPPSVVNRSVLDPASEASLLADPGAQYFDNMARSTCNLYVSSRIRRGTFRAAS